MDRLLILGFFVTVAGIGFFRLLNRLNQMRKEINFGEEFRERLQKYVISKGQSGEAYTWLIFNSETMQSNLGEFGIIALYRPPFANYTIKNYPIILNLLPELRRSLGDYDGLGLAYEYATLIEESSLRYLGVMDRRIKAIRAQLKNPIIWFREGIRLILEIPLALLASLGLINTSTVIRIIKSGLFRFIAAIITLISLLSAIVGLVIGWNEFVALVNRILSSN